MRGSRHTRPRTDFGGADALLRLALWLLAGVVVLVLPYAQAAEGCAQPKDSEQKKEESKQEEKRKKIDFKAALRAQEPCKILIVGFNGGFESPNNHTSGIVKLRDLLNTPEYPGVCFRNFLPYSWPRAYRWVLGKFPKHGGRFTPEEVERSPKVILMGHSLGGMTTLVLARLLGGRGIPVDLTVQLASFGLADSTVPSNVKNAANFYVRDALSFWTKKSVKVKDPAATHFIGNILVTDYDHASITRSPQVTNLVISTVRSLLAGDSAPRHPPAADPTAR